MILTGDASPSKQRQPGPKVDISGYPPARAGGQSDLKRNEHGQIDIPASLSSLGIADPKTLWNVVIQPGSPTHVLKKEIARALVGGKTIPGITLNDIGLSAPSH
jgi:hypothetical protein